MKRIFTLLLSFVAVMAVAQAPVGVFKQASTKPVIDGDVDAVWADANVYNIDKNFQAEVPSVGESTWKALWDDDGIFVIVEVEDDEWYPAYVPVNTEHWMFDEVEVYFDVNWKLDDAKGPSTANSGHIQVAHTPVEAKIDGTATTETNGVVWAYKVATNGSYVFECFVPYSRLVDENTIEMSKSNTIGFDVCVIDRDASDETRNRAVWSNDGKSDWPGDGVNNENYSNMDDAGRVTLDGVDVTVLVEEIALNTGTITTDNGTLQMVATISPANATTKKVKWSVTNGTGAASITADGLLTGLKDGTVTVKVVANDGSMVEQYADIEISGQVISKKEVWNIHNLITNWNFDTDLTGWGGWIDGDNIEGESNREWEDGVAVMNPGIYTADPAQFYHYQFNQGNLKAQPDVAYVLRFKAWAAADGTPASVDFEDPNNSYARYGASTDEGNVNGRGEWIFTINWDPQWYEYNVTFDQILENTNQQLQFAFSGTDEKIYVDSVLLVTKELWDLYPDMPSNRQKDFDNSVKVFPNPVGNANTLTVDLSSVNSKVAIYNSIGQKLMEKTADGKRAIFNVSSLRKGMYFVKSEDGTTVKFIK